MRDRIIHKLEELPVKVLYAAEAGSRAWGFASKDSDYDPRFIYLRHGRWYMTNNIQQKRDVIEVSDGEIDMSGWDLPKALVLFAKSNPNLIEWLYSPTVYVDDGWLGTTLRDIIEAEFSQRSCIFHYINMARGNYRDYLQGDRVWLKKYLYVVRPLLCSRYILEHGKFPPIEFDALINSVTVPDMPMAEIMALVEQKRHGSELSYGDAVPAISSFIDRELAEQVRLAELYRHSYDKESMMETVTDIFMRYQGE